MEVTVQIPVKPIVKAYLQYNYGNPVRLSRSSNAGKFFFSMVERPHTSYLDYQYRDQYQDAISIVVSEDLFLRKGFVLSKTNLIEFNNFITDIFYSNLFFFIEIYMEYSKEPVKLKDILIDFCQRFCIDENILPYETVKKAYYRHRKRTEKCL